ncbi:unnamed protein product, partial [Ectocarpus sp. 12 AP-2014]
ARSTPSGTTRRNGPEHDDGGGGDVCVFCLSAENRTSRFLKRERTQFSHNMSWTLVHRLNIYYWSKAFPLRVPDSGRVKTGDGGVHRRGHRGCGADGPCQGSKIYLHHNIFFVRQLVHTRPRYEMTREGRIHPAVTCVPAEQEYVPRSTYLSLNKNHQNTPPSIIVSCRYGDGGVTSGLREGVTVPRRGHDGVD